LRTLNKPINVKAGSGFKMLLILEWNPWISCIVDSWKIWVFFGFVQIVLTITNLEKLGSFFCRFICCLCLMKQNSDDLHACNMDSVISMKGFEFICPLSKRFFSYFILLNISFLLKWKIRLDYIFEKLMKISCVDFIFDFMFVMSGFKMFVPDLWKR
jgi:hypothetical protein